MRRLNGTRERATLAMRQPPLADPAFVELSTADGERTFVHRRVLRETAALTRLHLPVETGALLMGSTFVDGRGAYTVVTDVVLPLDGEVLGTAATVEITAEGRRRMEAEGQLRDPLAFPVGWMHSHPGMQAYFSGTDRAEQAQWTGAASVGLVCSGLARAEPPFRIYLGARAEEAFEWSRVPSEEARELSRRLVRVDADRDDRPVPGSDRGPSPAGSSGDGDASTRTGPLGSRLRVQRATPRRRKRAARAMAVLLLAIVVLAGSWLGVRAISSDASPRPSGSAGDARPRGGAPAATVATTPPIVAGDPVATTAVAPPGIGQDGSPRTGAAPVQPRGQAVR